jgi:hypothetical protein
MALFTEECVLISVRCCLHLIRSLWSTVHWYNRLALHARSPVHMPPNFLRCAKISQLKTIPWCANLSALLCTRSIAFAVFGFGRWLLWKRAFNCEALSEERPWQSCAERGGGEVRWCGGGEVMVALSTGNCLRFPQPQLFQSRLWGRLYSWGHYNIHHELPVKSTLRIQELHAVTFPRQTPLYGFHLGYLCFVLSLNILIINCLKFVRFAARFGC